MPVELPPFDPSSTCVKCGHSIPEPVAPMIKQGSGPDAKMVEGPMPERQPPNVTYCAEGDCLLYDGETAPAGDDALATEHMHATCSVCSYEWLTETADAGAP